MALPPHTIATIERLRRERGLTQAQAARAAGYKRGTSWANFLDGQSTPPLDRLEKIAAALGTTAAKLLAEGED